MTKLASRLAQMAQRRAHHGGGRLGTSRSTGKAQPQRGRSGNLRGYFRVGSDTTYNIVAYVVRRGRYVWLEGRVRNGVFRNWGRHYRYEPQQFKKPTNEAEIVELVKHSKRLRVFGAAHSFNAGIVSGETLVSLDDYRGLVCSDRERKQITVRAGTRVREISQLLFDEGLAFAALPSHDAQSIAGILSTDVHGSGRDHGFISESVVRLRLVDGLGEVHECEPSDELFKAAVGGLGAVGVITEVVVKGVERFNVEQKVETAHLEDVERKLDSLVNVHDHLSLYLFPFSELCLVNTWNRTAKRQSRLGGLREFANISEDALLAAWVGGLAASTGRLPAFSPIAYGWMFGSRLVLESNRAFNRTIYHLHQELEFSVPFEDALPVCRRFIDLYECLSPGLPYTLFEVRFTPPGHDRTLIGPGRDRGCAWIDLVSNDSPGFERFYAAAEELIGEIEGARRHLGKFCERLGPEEMAKLYGADFDRFLELRDRHDPERKFGNAFTRQLFGP
jgi:D-arabinono-1,4-lactone oxidase/FAD binding domain